MPRIRDTFSFGLTATAASIVVPMPAHEIGDLLMVFVNYDAGAPTWPTIAGWTREIAQANATAHSGAMYWKIAASAAEADLTIAHGSTNDTMCACSISVEDVDQTNPFGNPKLVSPSTQASSTRFAMPTITTNRNNALVFYWLSTTATSAGVHFVENKAHELVVVDGAAEGMGVGWIFQKTAGVTPSNIFACSAVDGVGVKAVLQVVPPLAGATVIPAYCASDASIFLNHNASLTAFDGCTQMAATADTRFGTTIASRTCNDATVAAVADIGVISYHGMSGVTNATTANQMSGAQVVMNAARYNIGTRNILAHIRPTAPIQVQRLTTLRSNRGIWFGLGSGATNAANYKVWQVHGVDVPILAGYFQPVVINPSNTDQIAANGTVSTVDVRNYGFWVGGVGALQSQIGIGPMWAMDTTVICGGYAASPIGLTEIYNVAAVAKERLSCLLQGSSQMLCLQAIQFGNGTEPVYLQLEDSAVEFPSKRNLAKKQAFYNGIDDSVGFTYYGVAGDTIYHRDSVISSASKYHWRIHPSATSAAAWDFAGLTIIGAGDVQLRAVTTFTEMVFTRCPTITQNSAVITSCSLEASTITSNNPSNISACAFSAGGVAGQHAIVITTPGTYTFTGNTFTGYGSAGTTSAAVYNNSGGAVTLNISGGGSVPTIRNGAGASTTVNASALLEFTGLQAGSEVRAYVGANPATATELAGVESSGTTFQFSHSVAGQQGFIMIASLGYEIIRLTITYSGADTSIPIQQRVDRNYDNPA